eukprot:TRINITY_DN664_c0_g1_i1.p1 TRINITY_DN664_c0_g1~~TRINITY_DN664_c0_g1_i1.p1  ORF type:complete len:173 (+),score=49.59 TRINITY_DN664_c0_g1_i1:68-586(+)
MLKLQKFKINKTFRQINKFNKNSIFRTLVDKPNEMHFKINNKSHKDYKQQFLFHNIYSHEELDDCKKTHIEPKTLSDTLALKTINVVRYLFDLFSGFKYGEKNEKRYLNRMIYLETVAGIPGMVAGSLRHLRSLRLMKRDYGWINTLIQEAENERMHMLTFLNIKQPGWIFS